MTMDSVRSLLLVLPGATPPDHAPDATLLDLRATDADARPAARDTAQRLLDEGHRVYLHLHPVASQQVLDDLAACLLPGVYGVSLPQALSLNQVRYVDSVLEEAEEKAGIDVGLTAIGLWIENAAALMQATELARASHRLTWLGVDGAALLGQLALSPDRHREALLYPRATVAFAAQAAGLPAVDGAEVDATPDQEIAVAQQARALGLRGKLTAHSEAAAAFASLFPAPPD